MAKTKPVDSYTIKATGKVVRVGDCMLMCSSEPGRPPYVARVESMEDNLTNNVTVKVRWYYRPEETLADHCSFHGSKELFLSDHYDFQSAETILDKCVVHTLKNYTKLANAGDEDYFSRFQYVAATGAFLPDRIEVYCRCEKPYNPDHFMVQCELCKDWFHPKCLKITTQDAEKLEHFLCPQCTAADDTIERKSDKSIQGSDKLVHTEVRRQL